MIHIPTWREAKDAVEGGNPSPLEVFIVNNEPSGYAEEQFREELGKMINYVITEAKELEL